MCLTDTAAQQAASARLPAPYLVMPRCQVIVTQCTAHCCNPARLGGRGDPQRVQLRIRGLRCPLPCRTLPMMQAARHHRTLKYPLLARQRAPTPPYSKPQPELASCSLWPRQWNHLNHSTKQLQVQRRRPRRVPLCTLQLPMQQRLLVAGLVRVRLHPVATRSLLVWCPQHHTSHADVHAANRRAPRQHDLDADGVVRRSNDSGHPQHTAVVSGHPARLLGAAHLPDARPRHRTSDRAPACMLLVQRAASMPCSEPRPVPKLWPQPRQRHPSVAPLHRRGMEFTHSMPHQTAGTRR